MGKNIKLKPIETLELNFKSKEEYLQWREKIFEIYEQSKIDYQKEMDELFGFTERENNN